MRASKYTCRNTFGPGETPVFKRDASPPPFGVKSAVIVNSLLATVSVGIPCVGGHLLNPVPARVGAMVDEESKSSLKSSEVKPAAVACGGRHGPLCRIDAPVLIMSDRPTATTYWWRS